MNKQKSKTTWQNVKSILVTKENRELLNLIGDLYSLNNKSQLPPPEVVA